MPKIEYRDDVVLNGSNAQPIDLAAIAAYLQMRWNNGTSVVVYVPGRGVEPDKSLRDEKIVAHLEAQHRVECIMINWDAKAGGILPWRLFDRERPLANAPRGAEKLAAVISAIASLSRSRGKISLLVHSIGNVVLQHCVTSGYWPVRGHAIFDIVLMTEPDANAQGHAAWLQRLAIAERVYVTMNADDRVLQHARQNRSAQQSALGLGRADESAVAATYLDLTGLVAKHHRVFAKGAMESQVAVFTVINEILQGRTPKFDASQISHRDGNLLQLADDRRPNGPIFKDSVPHEDVDA